MNYKLKFCVELKSIVNLICRKIGQQPFCNGEENLTTVQFWMIEYLYENQNRDIFQRDLESDFNIRRSTVSGILQNLERKGLIRKQSVNQDARLKKITLTEDAVSIHQEMFQRVAEMEETLTENITKEEWIVFYKVLEKIKSNLK